MSGLVDNHPLGREFPELRDRIHELKMADAHFSRLFTEYEDVDRAVVRAEQRVDLMADEALEKLKVRRVHLKDDLYRLLTETDPKT